MGRHLWDLLDPSVWGHKSMCLIHRMWKTRRLLKVRNWISYCNQFHHRDYHYHRGGGSWYDGEKDLIGTSVLAEEK